MSPFLFISFLFQILFCEDGGGGEEVGTNGDVWGGDGGGEEGARLRGRCYAAIKRRKGVFGP